VNFWSAAHTAVGEFVAAESSEINKRYFCCLFKLNYLRIPSWDEATQGLSICGKKTAYCAVTSGLLDGKGAHYSIGLQFLNILVHGMLG
jgi:hypothetical protein